MNWPVATSELSRLQRRLDFRRLVYFTRIVEMGSLCAAAVALRVAQPALTKSIRSLERDLDLVLLNRSPRGVTPTPAGMKLYGHCQTLLGQLELAHLDLTRDRTPLSTVRLGMPYSVGAVLAAPLLEAMAERYPDTELAITEKHTPELVGQTIAGKLDLAVISTEDRFPELIYEELLTEEMFLVAPFNRHAADLRIGINGPVEFEELRNAPVILPTPSLHLRILIEQRFRDAGVVLENVRELDVFSMILNCLDAGLGYSIMPAGWVHREIRSRRLRAASFRDRAAMSRAILLCRPRYGEPPEAVARLWTMIPGVMSDLVASGDWISARMSDG